MRNSIYIVIAIVILIAGMNTGCKHEAQSPTPFLDSGKFYLHLHTNIDTNEADYGNIYTTSAGRKVMITTAQLYLSNFQLVKSDGSIMTIPGRILLKVVENEEYYVATVPVGDYRSVKFAIGLDPVTNALASSADTSLNHPEMWFGIAAQPSGYIFVNLQGKIDTTANATGTIAQMQPFVYKVGTAAHYNTVTMPDHSPVYTVTNGQITFSHITIDYNKLFTGVMLNNNANLNVATPADNTSTISNTISANIPSMFSYEE